LSDLELEIISLDSYNEEVIEDCDELR